MQTIAQSFQQFVSDLELTDKQRDDASNQHTYLREQLQKRLDVQDNFLSGSYARNTAIRPLNDIDIFLVLGRRHTGLGPQQRLDLIKDTLKEIHGGKTSILQRRSVNIEFSKTKIAYDLVPAVLVREDVYSIPDLDASRWIETNPKKHQELSTAANEKANKKLKPLLKAVKHAKNVHGAKAARSFHLEVLSWSILTQDPGSYIEGLEKLLKGLAEKILAPCPDPAGLGPQIQPSRPHCLEAKIWLDKMAKLAGEARQLENAGKLGEAHAKLRELFGPQWPVKGTR